MALFVPDVFPPYRNEEQTDVLADQVEHSIHYGLVKLHFWTLSVPDKLGILEYCPGGKFIIVILLQLSFSQGTLKLSSRRQV